jgi:hypothetical protein
MNRATRRQAYCFAYGPQLGTADRRRRKAVDWRLISKQRLYAKQERDLERESSAHLARAGGSHGTVTGSVTVDMGTAQRQNNCELRGLMGPSRAALATSGRARHVHHIICAFASRSTDKRLSALSDPANVCTRRARHVAVMYAQQRSQGPRRNPRHAHRGGYCGHMGP